MKTNQVLIHALYSAINAGIGKTPVLLYNTKVCFVVFSSYKNSVLFSTYKAIAREIRKNRQFKTWTKQINRNRKVAYDFKI